MRVKRRYKKTSQNLSLTLLRLSAPSRTSKFSPNGHQKVVPHSAKNRGPQKLAPHRASHGVGLRHLRPFYPLLRKGQVNRFFPSFRTKILNGPLGASNLLYHHGKQGVRGRAGLLFCRADRASVDVRDRLFKKARGRGGGAGLLFDRAGTVFCSHTEIYAKRARPNRE